jgi:signal-transduction protein with cAMP-binding, CBS, and nucleotidyltransferase domain
MSDAQRVRDTQAADFALLDASMTVNKARKQLAKAGASYGILTDPNGTPVGLVTTGELAAVPIQETTLQEISGSPTFIVDADTLLDQAVSFSAQTLVENSRMAGLVIQDQKKVVGVLTRQTIRKHAERIKTRGGDITELAGVPQIQAKYFVCPKKDYKELVIYYDPDDPPTCPKHNLILVEQP